ncbi:hypothetical protein YH64_024480 [Achromobacter sp. LC458]|uniref:hypothetical protein n=1 Tax=unclassified Achromobacter TaxID=2626865 RepID=UPI00062A4813|nr:MULTISPECIES: hypothetical protein [unclassified Achromobacter]QYJ20212.1 hypothetical protein KYT87_21405 [Achromobacter sp. ES-001]TRM50383.1 hypothetical protein YH64_024480 [Achromobacter sp. LC458]
MHKPRNPTEQLAAAVRGRALYTRLYDKANAELSEVKGQAADLRERCATLASALEITTSILEASTDPHLKASATAARNLLSTAGLAPTTEAK